MSKKPIILHTEASNGWGGQEIRIINEILGMRSRGYEVVLATPPDAAIYNKARDAGIETFAVEMDKSRFISSVFRIARIIKERSVSIVNTHSSRDSWVGSIAGRLRGVKVLRTRHISSPFNESPLTRLVYGPLTDGVITTGDFIRRQIIRELRLNPDKVHSIPTGVDVESFISAKGDKVRAELGLSEKDLVIGTAAVHRSWKGHEYTIKAMPDVLSAVPEARLVLAGDGPQRHSLEGLVRDSGLADKVILPGHRDDIPEVIAAFDISVLASYASEGIPQFVLQSMAAGKPVIATEVGGIPEVVKDGVNGILVPPRDPSAIAHAVKALGSDPVLARRMGEAGRAMAAREHSMETMLDRIEALYKGVMS